MRLHNNIHMLLNAPCLCTTNSAKLPPNRIHVHSFVLAFFILSEKWNNSHIFRADYEFCICVDWFVFIEIKPKSNNIRCIVGWIAILMNFLTLTASTGFHNNVPKLTIYGSLESYWVPLFISDKHFQFASTKFCCHSNENRQISNFNSRGYVLF